MDQHSCFSEIVAASLTDMHLLHVFAVQAFHANKRVSYGEIEVRDELLFGHPERWVTFPTERRRWEKLETQRLRSEKIYPTDRSDRYSVARRANQYSRFCETHNGAGERQDVRWTVQDLSRKVSVFDEMLYRLYAMNLAVFGDKAARDLYVFSLLPCAEIEFVIPQDEHYKGTARLRVYALMKQLANQKKTKAKTLFSPVVAVAAILSPTWKEDGDQDNAQRVLPSMRAMIDLSLYIETATFRVQSEGGQILRYELMDIVRQTLENMLQDDYPAKEWEFCHLGLTQCSSFIIGVDGSKLPQAKLCDPRLDDSKWARYFPRYIAELADPRFRVATKRRSIWANDFELAREPNFAHTDLKGVVENYMPNECSFFVRRDEIGIVTPGRQVILHTLQDKYVKNAEERRGNRGRDFPETHDFGDHDLLNVAAWDASLLALITMQEALLQTRHEELSRSTNITGVREALNDFDDFYDVSLFDLPHSVKYHEVFDRLKHAIGLNRQYKALEEKLNIVQEGDAKGSLRLAKLALVISVVSTVITLVFSGCSWQDIRMLQADVHRAFQSAAPSRP